MDIPFLDTNIVLRHLLSDHIEHSPRATGAIRRIERGELHVLTTEIVIFEVVFTLARSYRQPRARIRDLLLELIELPGVILPGKRIFRRAFDLYLDLNISFADAYHAAVMEREGTTQVLSFDRDFDRVPGIQRVEP